MNDKDPLDAIDLDLDEFRNSVLAHLAYKDVEGLQRDSQAVMAPIFVEKFIDDIGPGNPWNDVLFVMASRLLEVSPQLRHLSAELEAKRPVTARPDADLEDLMVIENTDDGLTLRLRE